MSNSIADKINEVRESIVAIFSSRKKEKEAKDKKRRLIAVLTVFFIFLFIFAVLLAPVAAYEYMYADKIYSGVYIDGVNIGGLGKTEAIDKLNQHIDNLRNNGLNFSFQNKKANIAFVIVSPEDPDLAYQILNFDAEKMVASAYDYGRDNNLPINLFNQLQALLNQEKIELAYTLNDGDLQTILKQEFQPLEKPAQDAQILIKGEEIEILPETEGFVIDYQQGILDLKDALNLISINAISLKSQSSSPQVTKREAEFSRQLITEILKNEKIVLLYNDKKWEINKDEFQNWLAFAKQDGKIKIIFKKEAIENKLKLIAQEINVPAQDAKIVMTDGKVSEFTVHQNGLEVDLENSAGAINQDFFENKKTEIALVVKVIEPTIKTEQVNDMGIKEIIGTGVSDFSGSHTNRIKNITNAKEHLNGMLIAPNEEFSLSDRLGPVNGETGYFQEYVIKGDRTIPEYGGGLCQIATTIFRAALYSGLPITERNPHSYIVTYYKPIGMDAAIYQPHPDVRFINDTGHYILIQTYMKGTELKFEFWGTSDGRKVEVTNPEVYNWRSPGQEKLIENPKLKPGEKKLLEASRRGADAHFYRYLTKTNGEKTEEIFRSHYVAWPAIYEVGITPAEEGTGTTENTTENNGTEGAAEIPTESPAPTITN